MRPAAENAGFRLCLEAGDYATIHRRYSGRRCDNSGRLDDSFSRKKLAILFPVLQGLFRSDLPHIPRIPGGRPTAHGLFFVKIADDLNTNNRDIRVSHRNHMGLRCDKTVRLS